MTANPRKSVRSQRAMRTQNNDTGNFIAARDTARQKDGIWWAEKGAFHVVRVRDMVVEEKQ